MFWWFHRTCAIGSVEFMICSRIERSYLQRARKLTIVNRLSAPITKTSIAIAASMIMAGGRRAYRLVRRGGYDNRMCESEYSKHSVSC